MNAKAQGEQPADQAQQESRQLESLIGHRLLDALGRRGGSARAQVRRLWEGHYRVNLLTGEDPASTQRARRRPRRYTTTASTATSAAAAIPTSTSTCLSTGNSSGRGA